MQTGQVELVATDPTSQFSGAISQNAAAYLDLLLPESIAAGRTCRCKVREIAIVSVQNLGWDLWFFSKSRTGVEAITDIAFLGDVIISQASGTQIGAAGNWYYYANNLEIYYSVSDPQPDTAIERNKLHLALIPRTGAKLAYGAGGDIRVQFSLEPTLGW